MGQGGGGTIHALGGLLYSTFSVLGTNRKLRHEAQPGTGELTDIKDTLTVYTVLGGLEVE